MEVPAPPPDRLEGGLAAWYRLWYMLLTQKIPRLLLGTHRFVRKTHVMVPVKNCLDSWLRAWAKQVTTSWVSGMDPNQRETLYGALYEFAEDLYAAGRLDGDGLRHAVQKRRLPPFTIATPLIFLEPSPFPAPRKRPSPQWRSLFEHLLQALQEACLPPEYRYLSFKACQDFDSQLANWRVALLLPLTDYSLEQAGRGLAQYLDLRLFEQVKQQVVLNRNGVQSAVDFLLAIKPHSLLTLPPHLPNAALLAGEAPMAMPVPLGSPELSALLEGEAPMPFPPPSPSLPALREESPRPRGTWKVDPSFGSNRSPILSNFVGPFSLVNLFRQWYACLIRKIRYLVVQKSFAAEAAYDRLFRLLSEVFELAMHRESCGPAYTKAVSFTPEKLREDPSHLGLSPAAEVLQPLPAGLDVKYTVRFGQAWLTTVSKLYTTLITLWCFGSQSAATAQVDLSPHLKAWRNEMIRVFTSDYLATLSREQKVTLTYFLDLSLFDEVKKHILEVGLTHAVLFLTKERTPERISLFLGLPNSGTAPSDHVSELTFRRTASPLSHHQPLPTRLTHTPPPASPSIREYNFDDFVDPRMFEHEPEAEVGDSHAHVGPAQHHRHRGHYQSLGFSHRRSPQRSVFTPVARWQ
ncbi:hypothetical protein JCM10908_002692 [Rhodotorula pacifica]|uniref:uncharacterized protein n=1 Tax=Rhodotorula pacifica TaxID=1495444 RepID=UPI00316EFEEA